MDALFSVNNPITQTVWKIIQCIWLNILWLLTSIPIITLGASTTALYRCTIKMARDDSIKLTSEFFRSFRENFKQATIVWVMGLVCAGVCIVNFLALGSAEQVLLRLVGFLSLGVLILYVCLLVYLLPLLACFNNSIAGHFHSAMVLFFRNIHWSFCLVVLLIGLPLLILYKFLPLIVFGFPLVAFAQSFIYCTLFQEFWQDTQ